MARKNNTTPDRLLNFFLTGKDISVNQASSKFGISSATFRTRVAQLRKQGYAIYKNTITTGTGQTMQVFRLGQATRRVTAAGYAALALAKSGDPVVQGRLRTLGIKY